MTTSKEYEVGYRKPPEHAKWKKGQCGNPKRVRKRRVKPIAALVDEFLASEVEVIDNGVSQRRTAFEIIYLQLCNKAIAGNARALKVLKQYSDFAASRAPSGGMRTVWVDDEEYLKYLREQNERKKRKG
jgi:Family of unknown function (DUF5681)